MNFSSSPTGPLADTFRIGEADIDLRAGKLCRAGQVHRLEPRLAGVLQLLALRGITPVTRDEFLDTVWEENGTDEALNQAISRLRRLLGDSRLIRTLPRIGYCLVEPVGAADQVLLSSITPGEGDDDPGEALEGGRGPWWHRGSAILRQPVLGGFLAGVMASALVASVFWPRTIEQEFEIHTAGPGETVWLAREDTP